MTAAAAAEAAVAAAIAAELDVAAAYEAPLWPGTGPPPAAGPGLECPGKDDRPP